MIIKKLTRTLKQKLKRKEQLVRSLARYIVAGGIATAIHVLCFYLARHYGYGVTAANVFGFVIANGASYLLASFFVFRAQTVSLLQYQKFLLLSLVGFVVTVLVSQWVVWMMWHPWLAVAIAVVCIPLINFHLLRTVIFKKDA